MEILTNAERMMRFAKADKERLAVIESSTQQNDLSRFIVPAITVTYPVTAEERGALKNQKKWSMRGTVLPTVEAVTVHSTCDDDEYLLKTFSKGDTEWTYNVDLEYGNLCLRNTYTVRAYSSKTADPSHLLYGHAIRMESEVGFEWPGQLQMVQALERLQTGTRQSIKNDPSIMTTLAADFTCDTLEKHKQRPYFTQEITPVGFDLYAAVRTIEPSDYLLPWKTVWEHPIKDAEKKEKAEKQDVFVVVFYSKDGDRFIPRADIPLLVGWECDWAWNPSTFTVFRPAENRIIIDSVVGHESGPVVYIFDGEQWLLQYTLLSTFVPADKNRSAWTPLSVKADKTSFSLTETSYCCDRVNTRYPRQWSEFIFDVQTLKLVDIVFDERTSEER